VAASGEGDEPGGLTLAVDHVLCEELARDAKRVRLGHVPSLHDAHRFVYMM
jgi:hypothetical protein